MLNNSLTDDNVELLDLSSLLLKEFVCNLPEVFFDLESLFGLLLFLHVNTKLVMFSCQGLIFSLNFVLELSNLVLGNFEFLSQFNDLIVGLDKVLTVQISV